MAIASAAVFANFAALLGLTPLYPDVARDLKLGPDAFSAFFLVQGVINVILQLPVGVLADRIGRRPVLTLGMVFMGLAQLSAWQAHDASLFAASRVFTGLCGPFIAAASFAVVADAFRGARAQALGVVTAAATLGQAGGVLLAALVSPHVGWRGFVLLMAIPPALLLAPTLTVPEPDRPPVRQSLVRNLGAALRFLVRRPALALGASSALNLGAGIGATYLLPFAARERGLDARGVSVLLIAFLAGSALGGPVVGRIADSIGGRIPALTTSLLATVALVALGLSELNPVVAVPSLFLVGANVTVIAALASASIVDLAYRLGEGTGAALGAIRVGQGLGPGLFPTIAGVTFVRAGTAGAFLTLSAGMLLGLALSAGVRWTEPRGVGNA